MNYSAVNTKLRGVYARYIKDYPQLRLLEKKDLEETVQAVETWWQVDFGEGFNLYNINRALEIKVFNILKSFSYYLDGEVKDFYEGLLARYEIRDIKRILRSLVHEEDIGALRETIISLPTRFLETSESQLTVENFLHSLARTDYGRKLITYVNEPKDRILFYVEMTLDRSYYENLIKLSARLSKKDRGICEKVIGGHIDLLNLMYIYRGKNTYKIIPQEMINFIISGGESLSLNKLRDIIEDDSGDEFISNVSETKFASFFPGTRELGLVDIKIQQAIYKLNMKIFRESGMDIGKLLSLTILLEYCIRDVSTIIEAQRLGFGSDRTKSLLSAGQKEGVN